ncbi:nucleoside kinase, partial [Rhizobium ruizarguesonis]
GVGSNSADLVDKVFVLDIDVETLNRRLDGRPNEPGFEPAERALVLRSHHTREHLPIGISIETTGTVPSVVYDLLAQL